jgi:precorrin-6Y C5,15-methyltransferase (decarboxylating)
MTPWLSIVGIGEDGFLGLSPAARTLVDTAEVLIGGARHLAMIPDCPERKQQRLRWSSPLAAMLEQIEEMRGRRVCVLATGDPMHFGVGATLSRRVAAEEMIILPGLSAFALAAARLAWPLECVTALSVHGRHVELVLPHIAPHARLLILAHDARTPSQIATMLSERSFGASRMVVLAHMGGPNEFRRERVAHDWHGEVPDFHTLAVECVTEPDAIWHARTGLPDSAFTNDGKLTKREIRSAAMAKLMPHTDASLIDIGAGCGSIAIEWMRAAPHAHAVALEPNAERRAMAARNAANLGVPGLDIRDGRAPEALADLPSPDAIFIGGGVSEETLTAAQDKLIPGGRLVAHAVTLQSEAVLLAAHARYGGDLARLSVARAEPIGGFPAWRPLMPVTQWAWRKR